MNLNSLKRLQLIFIVSVVFSAPYALGQKVLIRGSAEKLIEDAKLMKQYEFEVVQWAINNALYEEFGSSVSSNYENLTETSLEGRSVKSHSNLRSNYLNTFPNGVWLGNKEEPKFDTYKDSKGNWWLNCEVIGWGKPVVTNKVEFVAKTLDGPNPVKDQTTNFMSGESGYVYFRTAEPGYITIFFDDFITVQRCFPYNDMSESYFPVQANTNYLLFNKSLANYLEEDFLIDEIEFYTEKEIEFNLFYIVFSKSPFSIPVLNTEEKLNNNYESFKSMGREDFQRWLQRNRLKNPDMQVEMIGITIKGTDE